MDQALHTSHADVSGGISVTFANGQTLDDFCVEHIAEYNRDRFEALAVRVYVADETVITIYAVDKQRQENSTVGLEKIPVKKFKLTHLPVSSLFAYCQNFNCTLSTGNFPLEDMEVINK